MTSAAQPFLCPEAGCGASYKRREYLVRHLATHQAAAHPCPHCDTTFVRKDSVRRHILLHHRDKPTPARVRAPTACLHCKACKTRCDGAVPCGYCLSRGLRCAAGDGAGLNLEPRAGLAATASPPPDADVARHVEAYFMHFHPTWPFLHRMSFHVAAETPLLAQAVVMVGMWAGAGTDDGQRRRAKEMWERVMGAVEAQKDNWDISNPDRMMTDDEGMWPMSTYQGILLSIIFATMTRSRLASQQLSESEYEVLVGLIKSCKRRGMFHYPRMHAQYDCAGVNQNTVMYIWVGIEEAKRFALAVYHVWKMCKDRGLGHHGDDDLLTVADLEFPIPVGEHLWLSESKELFLRRATEAIDAGDNPCNHEAEWICNGKGV